MKKYLVLIITVGFLACQQQEKGFEIEVDLEGADGKILLEKRGTSRWIPVDTAEIIDGIAVLKGTVSVPGDYYLSVLGRRAKTVVFVENAVMTVSGKVDSLGHVEVTGSVPHDEYDQVRNRLLEVSEEYMGLYQQARTAEASGDTAKAQQLMDQVNTLYESTKTIQKDFIKNNPGSFVAPFFLTQIQSGMELNELDELVGGLAPKLDSLASVRALKTRIAKMKTVAVGQTAPDFTLNDPEGNPVAFSDVYSQNEYTLLDFWAAWCGPCRSENPNVVAVYNDFKGQGFGVFGVSLDREKDAWLKAIEEDGLVWPHVSDLNYWDNAAARLYAVNSIPSSLIVDKNGKIVAKNKRGEALRETVRELLN